MNKCKKCIESKSYGCGLGVAISDRPECLKVIPLRVKTGRKVVANVTIQGARRGCGWRYVVYEADSNLPSGYRFLHSTTQGMYPNHSNYSWSEDFERDLRDAGDIVVIGRPRQGDNAPMVK